MAYKHGHRPKGKASPTYNSWCSLKQRCNKPSYQYYHRYGGRGITYDPRWESFENFLADMGERPEGRTLDRIDNDGNYCKENCRWATVKEQIKNRKELKVRTDNISGYKGVGWDKSINKWRAYVTLKGKRKYIGLFDYAWTAYYVICSYTEEHCK